MKAARGPAVDGGSYVGLVGEGVLGADVSITVGGVAACTPFFVEDFAVSTDTPEVCAPWRGGIGQYDEPPGFVASLLRDGTCSVDLRLPVANGGEGLSKRLSVTYAPAP